MYDEIYISHKQSSQGDCLKHFRMRMILNATWPGWLMAGKVIRNRSANNKIELLLVLQIIILTVL